MQRVSQISESREYNICAYRVMILLRRILYLNFAFVFPVGTEMLSLMKTVVSSGTKLSCVIIVYAHCYCVAREIERQRETEKKTVGETHRYARKVS